MAASSLPQRKSGRAFLEELLREQHELLTPVEEFSRAHDRGEASPSRFSRLLPATPISAGEQYAFEVDLDRCSGCKACVTACHSLNGLDENETWRDVGLLVEPPKRRRNRVEVPQRFTSSTALQHVTTACHHCIDPACLNGCPVLAYDKDRVTGIVRHLDDQCIGCQYCVLKCPYDVPKYNSRLGIVRKCDMCSHRLASNEAPACAQACPTEAIRITKVQSQTVTIGFRERGTTFLAGAPAGDYTLPTTRYVSEVRNRDLTASRTEVQRNVAQPAEGSGRCLVAVDYAELKTQPPHWPLVIMLVLTQVSVGIAFVSLVVSSRIAVSASLGFAVIGLGASVFHLGRPAGAWRGFLNVRRSWMSREIVVFGAYPALLAGALVFPKLSVVAVLFGTVGVFCSAMIYADTRRDLWRASRSVPLFFLTSMMLGASGAHFLFPTNSWLVGALTVLAVMKLSVEIAVVRRITDRALTPMRKTALLITGRFERVAFARLVALISGGLGVPLLIGVNALPHAFALASFVLLLAGEVCERYLFFRCVVAPKMPGGLTS